MVSKIKEINLSLIKEKMKSGEFQVALDDLVSLVDQENYSQLPQILEGILEIQEKGFSLSKEQLKRLKPFIDDFDESIQNSIVQIYMNYINKEIKSTEKDISMLISKTDNLEIDVRKKLISFLIESYYNLFEKEKIIINGLMSNLQDGSWDIRKRIIHFLDDLLINKPELIKNFEDQLTVLYNEKDVDVKKEALDFLLRLYIKTYNEEDIRNLITLIPEKKWNVQEKIIFLIGELGTHRTDLIKPIRKELLYLLDSSDYLVSDAIKEVLGKIMDVQTNIFDETFFEVIENKEIDNIGAIEDSLKSSIIEEGFDRFYNLFNLIDGGSNTMINTMNTIIRKINSTNPDLINPLFSKLTRKLLENLNTENFLKLKRLLEGNPKYSIYFNCYEVLTDIDLIDDSEAEKRRKALINFLLEQKPELNFSNIQRWLEVELTHGPIKINRIVEKFRVNESKLKKYIEKVIDTGELNAVMSNDTIAMKFKSPDEEEDLLFLKKWKIEENYKGTHKSQILLFIQIRNIKNQLIKDLKIELDYNKELLEFSLENQDFPIKVLGPGESLILTYALKKKVEKRVSDPNKSNININFIYEKNGKSHKIEKDLDVLFL